jgi:hypothetical protein
MVINFREPVWCLHTVCGSPPGNGPGATLDSFDRHLHLLFHKVLYTEPELPCANVIQKMLWKDSPTRISIHGIKRHPRFSQAECQQLADFATTSHRGESHDGDPPNNQSDNSECVSDGPIADVQGAAGEPDEFRAGDTEALGPRDGRLGLAINRAGAFSRECS